ncbi:1-deoxy-D-xylulose-5-phosphate synthase [Longimicrobium terrae]|uniref:1-deoxy-D-xylulose-5-phosphate synthase n=1 Tax=Longimicrobium terrae TaxID=1639882 RepID=A0A841GWK7_9BACT|nr:1-deoxy-D-xylulose-5-phosphate synthase [Longimicrobium terrae]MBB6069565.1 1-deoxy-D-xylulose-5-phosphate synthase [Longimicrobium terrae]
MALLDTVRTPEDVRALPESELPQLCADVRDRIIDVVSRHKGAHFGSNLGTVELTVALHRVFDTPRDQLIWDVGHQAYPHKILTGRNDRLDSIRKRGGLSGFLRRDESEFDVFGAGHAGTSISAAVGVAAARDIKGEDFEVIAVIGDGSMTCGLPYEALNNAGHTDRDVIVVLNDNQMSISPNVGALHKYLGIHKKLTDVRTSPLYNKVRAEVKRLVHQAPKLGTIGEMLEHFAVRADDAMKGMFVPGMLFEELGFRYVGPVDGHDIEALVSTFEQVRRMEGPRLVHVLTTKGKGFAPAEADQVKWHAAALFDRDTGAPLKKASAGGLPRYQQVFGEALTELATEDKRVVGITAAMSTGTGMDIFQAGHPDRFFDVGIAEGHAVTFAAGLATQGLRPVVAIYSTFLQRAYDNIVHDVALQDLPVTFVMDRAGIAGDDGATHHGGIDIGYMLSVPGLTITAPRDADELIGLLRTSLEHDAGPFSIRIPRDAVPALPKPVAEIQAVPYGTWQTLREGRDVAILATGTMVNPAVAAAEALQREGISATVVNCRFIKPLDEAALERLFPHHPHVLTVEEGTVANGFGAYVRKAIDDRWPQVAGASMGLPDAFVEHGERAELLADLGLNADGIAARARALLGRPLRSLAETA